MTAPERLEPKQIGGQIMLVRDPEGEYVAWDDYTTLAAEKERLERELAARDEQVKELLDANGPDCACGYDKADDVCLGHIPVLCRAEALAARVRSLEEALRPFAELSDRYPNEAVMVWAYLPELKYLRRARAALSTREEGKT